VWVRVTQFVRSRSRRLPTAAAGVPSQVTSCGVCGGQSGTAAGFLRVLEFLLPILIPLTDSHPSSSAGAGTVGQIVAHPAPRNWKKEVQCSSSHCLAARHTCHAQPEARAEASACAASRCHGDAPTRPAAAVGVRAQSRLGGWAGHIAYVGEKRNSHEVLVSKPAKKETTLKD
jgi:hypothetical protein